MKKSNHKHAYELCMQPRGDGLYRLVNVCSICGYRREPPFKVNLTKRVDGSWKWLCRAEDIRALYPDIKEVEPDA